jgi:hypothetical protein
LQGATGDLSSWQLLQAKEEELRQAEARKKEQEQWLAKNMPQFASAPEDVREAAIKAKYGQPDAPSNVREWQYFSQLSPEDQQRYLTMRRAQQWLDTGGSHIAPNPLDPTEPVAQVMKSPPPETDPAYKGRQTAEVEGARVEAERKANRPKAEAAMRTFTRQSRIMLDALGRLRDTYTPVSGLAYGVGGGNVPMTKMRQMQNYLKTIKANIGFQALQEMRANSPTGGALGQVAVQELEGLQATLGALDPASPDFLDQITEVERRVQEILAGVQGAFAQDYSQPATAPTAAPKVIDFNDLPE